MEGIAVLSARNEVHAGEFLDSAAQLFRSCGGSLGGILNIFVQGLEMFLQENHTPFSWNEAFLASLRFMNGNTSAAKLGDRTFLDALDPALRGSSLEHAAQAAREGANRTKHLKARVGRASYVPQQNYDGKIDAGAQAIAIFFQGLTEI